MELTEEQNTALKNLDNQNIVAEIMQKIREPKLNRFALPRTKQPDTRFIEYIKLPKDGGILTYFEGYKYPVKGFPVAEAVDKIDDVKKYTVAVLSSFKDMFSENKIKTIIFLILFRKQYQKGLEGLVNALWRQSKQYGLSRQYHCDTVREVLRVIDIIVEQQDVKKKGKFFSQLGRMIGMVLEFDDAYRYRFQYIIGNINKKAFDKKPLKELERVFTIGLNSEKSKRVIQSWKGVLLLIKLAKFSPKIKRNIVYFISQLDIERIKLSAGDRYYAEMKPDFKWQNPSR